VSLFDQYIQLLLAHNRRANLIGPLDEAAIRRDLIADSLLPGEVLAPEGALLDLGSGAGLPGIPLAIRFRDTPVHLVEPRQKRHTFLRIAVRRLGLDNVTIHGCRVEDLVLPDGVGTAAAKAFRPLPSLLDTYSSLLPPGGLGYLYVSDDTWDETTILASGFEVVGRRPHPNRPGRYGAVLRRG
jgi:16S rRNA (guanine527-N7)-methyltransferase